MTGYDEWLRSAAEHRKSVALQRILSPRQADDATVDLAGNDYLGLSRDSRVVEAAVAAAREWGAGSTASRLVTGTTSLHTALEADLASFTSAEAALVFSSGYTANLGVLQALTDRDTLIVSDAGNHASLIDGCRMSAARTEVTAHCDVAAVERALVSRHEPRAIVLTDAVFSIDGALAPLAELHELCRRHDALLVVDEAHAIGVIGDRGEGLTGALGLSASPGIVRTLTLSKSLGSQGGAVVATRSVIDQLVNTARSFIFDTGLAPSAVGAARAALQVLQAEPQLAPAVRRIARDLATELGCAPTDAAVVSVVIGHPAQAVAAAQACQKRGVLVGCFRPPSVPVGTSRLRLTARADLTEPDFRRAVDVVSAAVKDAE